MGDTAIALPKLYHHNQYINGDFESILSIFLLDPSFHSFVEKVEGELKTLIQEWRIVTALNNKVKSAWLFWFLNIFCVGSASWFQWNVLWFVIRWLKNIVKQKYLNLQLWAERVGKNIYHFKNFIQKKIVVSLISWLYNLVPQFSTLRRSIFTAINILILYLKRSHAATAVNFAMPASKWSHNIKASLSETNCSPYIYSRIHIA